jgi:hypothetical protein
MDLSGSLKKWVEDHDGELPHSIAMHPVTKKLLVPEVQDSKGPVKLMVGEISIELIVSDLLPEGMGMLMPKPMKMFEWPEIGFLDEDVQRCAGLRISNFL